MKRLLFLFVSTLLAGTTYASNLSKDVIAMVTNSSPVSYCFVTSILHFFTFSLIPNACILQKSLMPFCYHEELQYFRHS